MMWRGFPAALAAPVFVVLWSTGFVVARLAEKHAAALDFLCLRLGITALVLAFWAVWVRAPWPSRRIFGHLVVAGLLVQASYLGGVWLAIEGGMPAGLTALIVNLQPVLTAMVAPWWLAERIVPKAWVGLLLGFAGVAMVVAHRMAADSLRGGSLLYCLLALFGITAGSLWQKRFLPAFDLRTGTCIQYAASLFVLVPLAIVFDRRPVVWHPEMIGALLWSVFGLSIGAIFLMFLLIRRGEATRIASLFYLVPPTTAWMAWVLFDEGFGMVAALGMLVTALGVWLVQTNRAQPS